MSGNWGCSWDTPRAGPDLGLGFSFLLCYSVVSAPNLSGIETGSLTAASRRGWGLVHLRAWYVSVLGTGGSRPGPGLGASGHRAWPGSVPTSLSSDGMKSATSPSLCWAGPGPSAMGKEREVFWVQPGF